MKICSKCGNEKEENEFPKNKFWCKLCVAIYLKAYNNLRREEIALKKKKYQSNNKLEIKKNKKEYYLSNKEKLLSHQKEYQNTHKKERNKHLSLRYKNDPVYRCRIILSTSIRDMLTEKKSSKNGKSCLDYLKYTIKELKEHLEQQFEPWMTWQNQGIYNPNTWDDNDPSTWTWQIDHIIPHSIFRYTSMKDHAFQECWALKNLRPLSAKQNLLKSDKLETV